MKALLRELRRRNVWRAMLLYIGATWALAQGISELSSPLGLPDWAPRAFLIAGAIGFPFWIAFAWLYEITPDGLKRESEVDEAESITRQTGRKLDYWIIGVLTVAVVLLLTDRLLPEPVEDPDATRSIAVLPLANAGGDNDDYFADGLSEELISGLTRIPDLRVIGSSSAFEFKGSRDPRSAIARKLGVAHLLEGKVRRHGDQVRIMLELIRPADGTSLWSQTYSREMKDIFAVQAEIARAVANALQVQFGEDAIDYTRPPNGNLAAYDAALQGRVIARQPTIESQERSIALLRKAIQLEPDYAFAHAILANVLVNLAVARGNLSDPVLVAEARAAADTAIRLAPDYSTSLTSQGYVLQVLAGDLDAAGAAYRKAREIAPNEGAPALFLAGYLQQVGRHDESIALMREAIAREPLRIDWHLRLVWALQTANRFEEALAATQRVLEIAPDNAVALDRMAWELREQGRYGESIAYSRRAIAADPTYMQYRAALAYSLVGDGRFDEAIRTLHEALEIQPGHADLHYAMGDLLLWYGRFEEALVHGRKAAEINPQFFYYHYVHAMALANLDRLDEAEQVMRKAAALNTGEPWAHALHAEIALLLGDRETARATAETEVDPDARRYARGLLAAADGDQTALDSAIASLLEDCTTRQRYCMYAAAALRAHARQPEQMHALLAQLEQEPGYHPNMSVRLFEPYYSDPRYLRHLDKYGLSPPSPVSRALRAH